MTTTVRQLIEQLEEHHPDETVLVQDRVLDLGENPDENAEHGDRLVEVTRKVDPAVEPTVDHGHPVVLIRPEASE